MKRQSCSRDARHGGSCWSRGADDGCKGYHRGMKGERPKVERLLRTKYSFVSSAQPCRCPSFLFLVNEPLSAHFHRPHLDKREEDEAELEYLSRIVETMISLGVSSSIK